MKVAIINKSDSTGGAAVVSRRLMDALRKEGVDARMLVTEKLSDSPYVSLIAAPWRIKAAFMADRLRIALANGFNRKTLFQLDAAAAGIDLSCDPLVREADAVIINWINQGVLSLKGIEKIAGMGKRVLWTMHDMWNMTGLCHHAGSCRRFTLREANTNNPGTALSGLRGFSHDIPCGDCPLLGRHAQRHDLSYHTARRKMRLYSEAGIEFVAVSNWLAEKARASALLRDQEVHVIPNAFPIPDEKGVRISPRPAATKQLRIIFGAARLDDPIKNFPLLAEVMKTLSERDQELASRTALVLFGAIKDESLIERLREDAKGVTVTHTGMLKSPQAVANLYRQAHIVLSTSNYETLPGTLIEGQAYGCWPIATDSGGQSDIIDEGVTGNLIHTDRPQSETAADFADRIIEAAELLGSDHLVPEILRQSVIDRFAASVIARRYMSLLS